MLKQSLPEWMVRFDLSRTFGDVPDDGFTALQARESEDFFSGDAIGTEHGCGHAKTVERVWQGRRHQGHRQFLI